MGTYYKIACDDLQENIDSFHIKGSGIKAYAVAHTANPLGPIAVFAMLNMWHGHSVRLVSDAGGDAGYFEYTDVTEKILEEYNARYQANLEFRPYPPTP